LYGGGFAVRKEETLWETPPAGVGGGFLSAKGNPTGLRAARKRNALSSEEKKKKYARAEGRLDKEKRKTRFGKKGVRKLKKDHL